MENSDVFSLDQLITKMRDEEWHPKFIFFWGHKTEYGMQVGPWFLSQWYPAPFTIDDIQYPTAEHYFMAEKARLFKDDAALSQILATSHPNTAKRLGRQVIGFDETVWAKHRFEIVVQGNEAKFSQNEILREYLMKTGERVLVEASPRDRIWGIGLKADDRRAEYPTEWNGLNLLGFALMKVRAKLLSA